MDPEIASRVVIGVTAVGAFAWLAGLIAMLRAERDWRKSSRMPSQRFGIEDVPDPGSIVGEVEIDGNPEELSTRLTGLLAREGLVALYPILIVASSPREIVIESAGPSQFGFRGGRIRLAPEGSRTKIDYRMRVGSRGPLIVGWMMVGLALIAVTAAPLLAASFLVNSPNPQVRTQSFQVVQMVHFLWPPFLLAHLARQPSRIFRARFESLLHNLPYT
ncbi:hypothetical protein P12x_004586 [Tundrisphaera lichenicola]|uniref:hypothetical protein n=1 Tax=Tundrisphaera lichenicola TaxID=2029860 RepID=UPI003EBDDFB5